VTYTPNFRDPRIKKKVKRALGFCCSSLSVDKPRAWARVELDRWFGTQNHNFSKWLRSQLLREDSKRYNKDTGECKKWLLREEGVDYLCEIYNDYLITKLPSVAQVSKRREIALDWAEEQYKEQLATGLFQYQEKSNRLWNDIQRIPSAIRKPLFAKHGYEYEYDIQACAPTLITQLARNQGLTRPTPVLDLFLADRQHYRTALAERIGCTPRQSKEILNAIFAGAKLGPGNSIATILNNNRHQLSLLRDNQWFCDLRKDIKKCWDSIKTAEKSVRLSSRDKWMIYFGLEKSVMSVIRRELIKEGNRHFLEHDGWRCESWCDPDRLRRSVKSKTGYDIQIDYVRIIYTI
jgi:hypothetical protein